MFKKCRLSLLAIVFLAALMAPQASFAQEKPLLMEGKQKLYQTKGL